MDDEPLSLIQAMSASNNILSYTARGTGILYSWPDFRCRRLILVPSRLNRIVLGLNTRCGHYLRQVGRRTAWLSTLSQ